MAVMKLISKEELADLIRASIKLSYLEAGGVDNCCLLYTSDAADE